MNAKLLILLGLLAMAAADIRPIYDNEGESEDSSSEESYESSEAKYSFSWAVSDDSSSNEFGHQESRDGDFTQGSYYVQLPDGRVQRVSYHVDDDDGYVAEVTYEGEIESEESDESNESD
ncbi:pro-resilin-like [Macrobrachium rosenbergii]|uniref:pro-resilin-like n=1 Tax=Macrobrachium rosenbergii TaxID=79674 RepID=UPI0034D3D602